ncbi:hypothetical protein QBC46DRAFT_412340 [Diplogelasinospora grovesii]|uniref:Uncharacterized protein n=1 Tax=Diplogelasinospora grovesii TaxID=303347 RepID=A0AAN6N075_9PEZI|nr:hypothetical protein QBC46DRAFT_412340 [Diplogelasinospora grovesii]
MRQGIHGILASNFRLQAWDFQDQRASMKMPQPKPRQTHLITENSGDESLQVATSGTQPAAKLSSVTVDDHYDLSTPIPGIDKRLPNSRVETSDSGVKMTTMRGSSWCQGRCTKPSTSHIRTFKIMPGRSSIAMIMVGTSPETGRPSIGVIFCFKEPEDSKSPCSTRRSRIDYTAAKSPSRFGFSMDVGMLNPLCRRMSLSAAGSSTDPWCEPECLW